MTKKSIIHSVFTECDEWTKEKRIIITTNAALESDIGAEVNIKWIEYMYFVNWNEVIGNCFYIHNISVSFKFQIIIINIMHI